MDDIDFDEWAAKRQLPPGLTFGQPHSFWPYLRRFALRPLKRHGVNAAMWLLGEYQRGIDDALDVQLGEVMIPVPGLDPRLDGVSILHLSDLHLGALAGTQAAVEAAVSGTKVDLCVLTGDYAPRYDQRTDAVIDGMRQILAGVVARYGVYATLGNYDSSDLTKALISSGLCRVLINDTVHLPINDAPISITGTDDPYLQEPAGILAALSHPGEGFRIALVHTPYMAEEAAAAGHDLYLCGHTHGGQICLPGGQPVLTNCKRRSDLASGLWREGSMWGYTSRGAGVSSIARRHNCPPEVTILRLVAGHAIATS